MRVCLVDTETTGLDPKKDHIIELAAMLYDTEHASAVESFACLVKVEGGNAAEAVNGIPSALLDKNGDDVGPVLRRFWGLAAEAECVMAHRAEFDQGFVFAETFSLQEAVDNADKYKPWVCTKTDIEWPGGRRGDHLVQLALSLGLGVASAHRAASDVDTMARILTRAQEVMLAERLRSVPEQLGGPVDMLAPLFRRAMRPKVRVVSLAPFDKKDVVKAHGFLWYPEEKVWARRMPMEDSAALPFRTRVEA